MIHLGGTMQDMLERLIHIEDKVNILLDNGGSGYQGAHTRPSYSQFGEDVLVYDFFRMRIGMEKFSYIDLGANDPYDISNTAYLYQKGCRGINVDANPILIEKFKKARPEDTNVNCGVSGGGADVLSYYMIDDWSGRNTFNKELAEKFVEENPEFRISKVMKVKVCTLEEILREYNDSRMPDYMTIDVESMEYEVLSAYDLKNNGPKVLTIEIKADDPQNKENLKRLLLDSGYVFWVRTIDNYTWVKKEYEPYVNV